MLIKIEDSEEGLTSFSVEGEERQPFLVGELNILPPGDLLTFLNTARSSGRLAIEMDGGVRKNVYLAEGEVVFADSNALGDGIADVLWREGLISHEQLLELEASQPPEKTIWDHCVESGVATATQLEKAWARLVREIVVSLIGHEFGRFLFIAEHIDVLQRIDLEGSTHDLILDGFRSLTDLERYGSLVPLHLPHEGRPGETKDLSAQEQVVLGLADGSLSGVEIIAASRLGELLGLRVLFDLTKAGLIAPLKTGAVNTEAGGEAIDAGDLEAADSKMELTSVGESIADTSTEPGDGVQAEEADWPGEPDSEMDIISVGESIADTAANPEFAGQEEEAQRLETEPEPEPDPEPEGNLHGKLDASALFGSMEEDDGEVEPCEKDPEESDPPETTGGDAREPSMESEVDRMPFLAYSKAAARIYEALQEAQQGIDEMNAYFESAPEAYRPLFEGVRIKDGVLDTPRVLENAKRLHGDDYKNRAIEALEAFQGFSLSKAKGALPPEVSNKLQHLVMLTHLGKG